jgi:hypothetical protein
LLPDGKVLVAGGTDSSGAATNSAELYDPATQTWTPTGSLAGKRSSHTAILLPNAQVLVAGGFGPGTLSSAELYDPVIGIWTSAGGMNAARGLHTATLLPNGNALLAGGFGSTSNLTSAELYDSGSMS